MQEIVGGCKLWPRITGLMRFASRRRVAIAYVSSANLLPLQPGDQLIVDASIDRIISGATDPSALLKWIELGVEVWSCPTLHAKVVVTNTHAVISSANASVNSGARLDEAAILTDDLGVRRSADELLDGWMTQSIRLEAGGLADMVPLFGLERVAGRPTLWETRSSVPAREADVHFDVRRRAYAC
jgi:phosphatidylserine/phosphatidylglycerophosphate/cardiolipin synthase-like enzyme